MVIEYIRYVIAESQRVQFEEAYRKAAAPLAEAVQCVDYELSRCVEEPGAYILRIRWTSAEDHLKGFRSSPLFRAYFSGLKGYVNDIEEMRHYEPTGVEGAGSAV